MIYLNGLEAGRVRITNDYNAASYAQGFSTEGSIDPVIITNLSLLQQGENCLAVEVHQFLATSSDIAWGMKLVALPDTLREAGSKLCAINVLSRTNSRWFGGANDTCVCAGISD